MATFRYVPETIMTVVQTNPILGSIRPIVKREFVPVSARVKDDYCIVPSMGVLKLTTDTGAVRVYGMDDATITSDLRMAVTRKEWTDNPDSCRDEVIRNQWPIVTEF